jgi:RNA-directed DNA polymerase
MPEKSIFSLTKLLKAYFLCRAHKRNTINALKFELNLETNLIDLQSRLINRSYKPNRSICFIVVYPKIREIFAADFSDRIIHHLLVQEIEPFFEKMLINNSFACRKNKGTSIAINNLYISLSKITKNNKISAFYGQFDMKSFFTRIDKQILYTAVETKILKLKQRCFWKSEIIYLLKTIIFHNPVKNYALKGNRKNFCKLPHQKSLFYTPKNKGLPLGSLDQYVKRDLKVKNYFRYVDDLVLLSDNQNEIKKWRYEIGNFLKRKLKLELHPAKDKYGSVYSGIDFVGYIVRPNYILSRKRVVSNLKTKLFYFNQKRKNFLNVRPPEKREIKYIASVVNSYFGHFRQANCYNLRKNIYEKHFGELKKYLKPQNDFKYFRPI